MKTLLTVLSDTTVNIIMIRRGIESEIAVQSVILYHWTTDRTRTVSKEMGIHVRHFYFDEKIVNYKINLDCMEVDSDT